MMKFFSLVDDDLRHFGTAIMDKSRWDMKITNLYSLGVNSTLSPRER